MALETLFITVQTIDRYLQVRQVRRSKLQLVGVAALLVSILVFVYNNTSRSFMLNLHLLSFSFPPSTRRSTLLKSRSLSTLPTRRTPSKRFLRWSQTSSRPLTTSSACPLPTLSSAASSRLPMPIVSWFSCAAISLSAASRSTPSSSIYPLR